MLSHRPKKNVNSFFIINYSATENRVLSLIKKYRDRPDKEIIKMSGLSKGTFYK